MYVTLKMDYTDETIENVAESVVTIIQKYLVPLGEFILFHFLFTYNECLAALQIFVWCAKKDYVVISYLADFTVKFMEYVGALLRFTLGYFLHSHTEPLYPNWICTIEVGKIGRELDTPTESLFFIEQYSKLNNTYNTPVDAIAYHSVEKKCTEYVDFLNHERIYEALIMCKFQQGYIVRIMNQETLSQREQQTPQQQITEYTPSSAEFLSIVYCHPENSQILEIKLPREIYATGNEILSMSHVWRCIQYSSVFPNKIRFDENYKLHIIDHQALRFEIGFHHYILLEENEYKIMYVGK